MFCKNYFQVSNLFAEKNEVSLKQFKLSLRAQKCLRVHNVHMMDINMSFQI